MRKLLTSVLLLVLALVIASPALAQSSTVTLWADNSNINAGNVTVSIDGDNLVITYQTTDGWELTETHLYVGTDVPTKSAPGKFPYKHEDLGNVTSDSFVIALSELGVGPGDTLVIAAQAALQQFVGLDEEDNPIYAEESAWAEGTAIREGKNWAMYFTFTIE